MFSLLIIDDEEPVREAIRILGRWGELGIDQLHEATDGKSGLALLQREKIDLVLVDMKMPEIDGVEFLQIVEQDYPNLLAIVISGYNDFEFTRQAIRSKVVDYLLKPINRLDLNQALRKAIDLLEVKRRNESDFINKNITLNMSLPKLKEKIYLSIIERSFKQQTNEALLPLIGADLPGNHFGAVVLRILNLEHICKVRFNQDMDLLHFAVANVMSEIAVKDLQCFCFGSPKLDREMIAVYTMPGGYPEDLAFRADHLTRKSVAMLKELFGIMISAGIGEPCIDVMDIAVSYEAAKAGVHSIPLLKLKDGIVISKAEKKL
ncbi:MAG: response regulator, partial [Gorillibacterium sp.]|nr:response regulator [Gorillibacterium sp.]